VPAAVSSDARQTLGKRGEELACRELRRRGYAILDRRYRTRMGEIDIVARHREATVFVEVKARRDGRFGGAAAAVTPWKQRRLALMAVDYLARRRWLDRPCRFDVVTVEIGEGRICVEVYTHAFDAC
jgi:putative endonuclease